MNLKLCPAYYSVLSDTHTLIAGTNGSGKSTLIKGALQELIKQAPKNEYTLCLIDPKMVELQRFKKYAEFYADNERTIIQTINKCKIILENRFKYMKKHNLTEFPGDFFYIVIDEFVDLMGYKKMIYDNLSYIARLGRAGRMFLIIGTQLPGRVSGLPVEVNANLVTRIALRCVSAIESRQVIHKQGAELLSLYGQCIIERPGSELFYADIPMYEEAI